MAARTKFAAAVAAVAALWAATLLFGCGGKTDKIMDSTDRIFTEVLADGRTVEVPTWPQTGYYMEDLNGEPYMFVEDYGPITLTAQLDGVSFDTYTNGDEITVWCQIIEESYPAHTYVYETALVEEGDVDGLPQAVLDEIDTLKELQRYFFLTDVAE